jgi:hypothetical protein
MKRKAHGAQEPRHISVICRGYEHRAIVNNLAIRPHRHVISVSLRASERDFPAERGRSL